MPKYHFRVETTYGGPSVIHAKDFHDLLDKVKLWVGHTMPAKLNVEFLREAERIDEEGAPHVL